MLQFIFLEKTNKFSIVDKIKQLLALIYEKCHKKSNFSLCKKMIK